MSLRLCIWGILSTFLGQKVFWEGDFWSCPSKEKLPNEVRKGLHFSLANTLIKELSAELTSTLEPFSLLPALRSQCFCEMAERRKTILRNEICIEDRWKKRKEKKTERKEERRWGKKGESQWIIKAGDWVLHLSPLCAGCRLFRCYLAVWSASKTALGAVGDRELVIL